MATNTIFDAVVIGAGVEGSATAYQFAKQKYNTLLLEQFPLPHSRGSSHGQSRIIRCAYKETFFARMVLDAMNMWKELEHETNTEIYKKCGVLVINDKAPHTEIADYVKGITSVQKPYRLYTGAELRRKYPGALNYAPDSKGMIEPEGGLLRADKALRSFQEQFKKFGGTIHDETCVKEIIPGDIITLRTDKGEYRTKRLVIAAGPWAAQMLKPLGLNFPLQIQKVNVCYWKEKKPGMYAKYPCFLGCEGTGNIYGLPPSEYPGMMKVCHHGGLHINKPEDRDRFHESRDDINAMAAYIKANLPGLETTPSIVEACMYTCTPDEYPILGTHPNHNNLAFVCGLSGTGFKIAPAIGKVLCELVTGQPVSHDISPYSFKRFYRNTTDQQIYSSTGNNRQSKPAVFAKSKL